MTTIKTLFKKYWLYLFFIIVLSTLVNGINLYVPKLIGETVDQLNKNANINLNPIYTIILIGFAYLILSFLELAVATYFSEKFAKDTRIATMNNLVKQPYQYVINEGPAKVITVLGSDIDNIQDNFTTSLTFIFQAIVLFFGAAFLMFSVNWRLTLIALISIPMICTVFFLIFSKIGKLFQLSQVNLTDLNNTIAENINSSSLVRVLSSFKWENAKYSNNSEQSKSISFKVIKGFSTMLPLVNLIMDLTILTILYIGFQAFGKQEMSLGQITTFIGYYQLLITPIFIIGFTSQAIGQAFASWKRVEPILNAREQRESGIFIPKELISEFELKNVDLVYYGKKVLDNLNFKIHNKQKTAILGPTGAGKSQLLNLLLGLSVVSTGQILLNDKSIYEYDTNWLISKVGICFQDSLIFDNTLRYNIDIGRRLTDDQIQKAIDTANLREFTNENGLDSHIAERGANLSGGQKQRITLARAIASEPELLLLDDFTARVDSKTELEIKNKLSINYPNITLIQIAQKIESIKDYDNIIVLMEGQIVGQGTHLELLQNCLEYQQINQSQQLI